MTKAIGSVAALQLVEQGKNNIDEPLDKYLPEMASIKIIDRNNEIVDKNSITLRNLLTHTAGFGYRFSSEKLSKWEKLKKKSGGMKLSPRLFESGTSYMYGNMIGLVDSEEISKMNLEDYFRNT